MTPDPPPQDEPETRPKEDPLALLWQVVARQRYLEHYAGMPAYQREEQCPYREEDWR